MGETVQINNNYDILCHHGVIGQRWGVRRYQNPDGTLIHPKTNKKRQKALKKAQKVRKKNLTIKKKEERKAAKAVKAEEKRKQTIENAIRSGDSNTVYKLRSKMTDEELARAVNRIQVTKAVTSNIVEPQDATKVKDLKKTQENREIKKSGKETVDKVLAVAGTAVSLYQAYNKTASMINEVSGEKKLPTFDISPWSKKDSANKNDKQSGQAPSIKTTESQLKQQKQAVNNIIDLGKKTINSWNDKDSFMFDSFQDVYYDNADVYVMKHSDYDHDILCHHGVIGQRCGPSKHVKRNN